MSLIIGVGDIGLGGILSLAQQASQSASDTLSSAQTIKSDVLAIKGQVQDIAGGLTGLAGAATANSVSALRTSNAESVKIDLLGFAATLDGGAGEFIYDPTDTTTPDDGAMCIVKAGGKRYKRSVPDRILTPQMFGAKGNDPTHDDGPGLLAWIRTPSKYTHYLPAGTYYSSLELSRVDMGAFELRGGGMTQARIIFTGDTGGIFIKNTDTGLTGSYGPVSLSSFEINSNATKTNRDAIYIETGHLNRPGPTVQDVAVFSKGSSAQQWARYIHYHNCSATSTRHIVGEGVNQEKTIGIHFTATPGLPSVEHNIYDINFPAIKTGVQWESFGNSGIEGVKISQASLVGVGTGIIGNNATASGPDVVLDGVHINSIGGPAVWLKNHTQVTLGLGSQFYTNATLGGVSPECAVYLENINGIDGFINATTFGNSQHAVKFVGTSRNANLFVKAEVAYGATNAVYVPSANFDMRFMNINRIWRGNGSLGANTGQHLIDDSGNATLIGEDPFNGGNFVNFATLPGSGELNMAPFLAKRILLDGAGNALSSIAGSRATHFPLRLQANNAPLTILNNNNIRIPSGENLVLPVGGSVVLEYTNNIWQAISILTGKEGATLSFSPSPAGMGGTASASSAANGTPASNAIDGLLAYNPLSFWQSSAQTYPQWLEINHRRMIRCESATVVSLQDSFNNPTLPDSGTTGSTFVIRDFQVQYHNGTSWLTIATVTDNNKVLRTVNFGQVMAQRFRIYITKGGTADNYSRLAQVYFSGPDTLSPLPLVAESTSNPKSLNGLFLNASSVVDPSLNQLVRCNNGSSAMDVTIDYTKAIVDVPIYVRKYDASSTGNITVKTTNPALSKIQGIDGIFYNAFTLSPTTLRSYSWVFNGVHFELISA